MRNHKLRHTRLDTLTIIYQKAPVTHKPKSNSNQKQRIYLTEPPASASTFNPSKRDKRAIKSSVFRSKIEKASAKSSTKRRRPSKKLVATLESLANSLPELQSSANENPASGAHSGTSGLRSRPGAKKKNERLDKSERKRFAQNMALLQQSVADPTNNDSDAGSHRWAALRQHISSSIGLKGSSKPG